MEYILQSTHGTLLGRKVVSRQDMDVPLEKGELFRVENSSHGQFIQVVEGRVWLTEAGSRDDIILEKGQMHRVTGGGGVTLIQGMPTGRIRFI